MIVILKDVDEIIAAQVKQTWSTQQILSYKSINP